MINCPNAIIRQCILNAYYNANSLIVNVVFIDALLFVPMIVFNIFHDFAQSFFVEIGLITVVYYFCHF